MALGYDGSIRIDTRIDPKGFNTGISSMLSGVKKVAVALAAVFGAKLAAQAAAGVVKLAADFQRLELAADAVGRMFGYTLKQTRAITGELIDLGIQTDTANKAFINFAREGLDTSLLPMLARGAQDLNVFAEAGATSSDVLDRLLHGILTLNPLILRNAGVAVDLGEAYKAYAAANGIAVAQMTTQEKRQAALIAVTEKLTGVTGLYEISQRTLAGQMASNTRIVNEFKAALGRPFTGAVFTVVKAWNDLLKAFTKAIGPGGQLRSLFINLAAAAQILANGLARVIQFIGALFGAKIEIATQTTGALADTTGDLAGSAGDAAGAQGDLADNTNKATKAAKGALAAFDELNVLQQAEPAAGSGGGVGGGGGGGEPINIEPGPITEALDEIGAAVDALKERFMKFIEPLLEPLARLKEAIEGLGGRIWDGLKWAYDNILLPLSQWVMNEALPRFIDLLAAGVELLNDIIDAAKPSLLWLWETFLQPLAEWVGDKIIEGIEALTERLEGLGEWVQNNQATMDILVLLLASLAAGFLIVGIAMGLMLLVGGALTAVMTALSSPIVIVALIIGLLIFLAILLVKHWDELKEKALEVWTNIKEWAADAWENIQEKWEGVKAWFQEKVIQPLRDLFGPLWDWLKIVAANAWLVISFIWGIVSAWFSEHVTEPIKQFFSDLWENLKTWASDAWTKVQEVWEVAKTWFQDTVIDPIKDAFSTALDAIKEKWETIFTGIKDFVKGIFNSMIDAINGLMSGIVEGINTLIEAANRAGGIIPGWQTIPLLTAPKIPQLATGAYVPANARMLAEIGHGRPEYVLPDNKLEELLTKVQGQQGSQEIVIRFEGALGALVRELKPYIDKENVRIGGSLITAKGSA